MIYLFFRYLSLDPDQQVETVIPFVFAGSPDKNTLEAAGILSST
jgi:hypothetical protein